MMKAKCFTLIFVGLLIINSQSCAQNKISLHSEYCSQLLGENNKDSLKLKAILEMEKRGNSDDASCLIVALKDENFPYRLSSIHALSIIGGNVAIEYLEKRFEELYDLLQQKVVSSKRSAYLSEQVYVAGALFKLGQEAYTDKLYDAAKSQEKTLRYNSAMALGMVNTAKSKKLLYDILLNDRMDLPRCGAANALIELNDKDVVRTLQDLLKSGKGVQCFNDFI